MFNEKNLGFIPVQTSGHPRHIISCLVPHHFFMHMYTHRKEAKHIQTGKDRRKLLFCDLKRSDKEQTSDFTTM